MAKIKKVIEKGGIQYPATITDAVKNPNNGKTVTEELSELGQEQRKYTQCLKLSDLSAYKDGYYLRNDSKTSNESFSVVTIDVENIDSIFVRSNSIKGNQYVTLWRTLDKSKEIVLDYCKDKADVKYEDVVNVSNASFIEITSTLDHDWEAYYNAIEPELKELAQNVEGVGIHVEKINGEVESLMGHDMLLDDINDFVPFEDDYEIIDRVVKTNGSLVTTEGFHARVYNITELNREYVIASPIKDNQYIGVWAAYLDNTLVAHGESTAVASSQFAKLSDKTFNKLYVSFADEDSVEVKWRYNYSYKNKKDINYLNSEIYGGNLNKELEVSDVKNEYRITKTPSVSRYEGDFAVCVYNVERLEGKLFVRSTLSNNQYCKAYMLVDSSGSVLLSGETTDISQEGTVELTKELKASILYVQATVSNPYPIVNLEYEDIGLKRKVESIETKITQKMKNGYSQTFDVINVGTTTLGYEYSCGNKILSLTTDIEDGFSELTFGLGKSVYAGAYIKVGATNIQFISRSSSENELLNKEHGLSISNFLSILIDIDRKNNAKGIIYDGVNTFEFQVETKVLASGDGSLFIDTNSVLRNVSVCASSKNYNSKVWFIGDSYISTISNSRWGYHLINTFGINQMVLGFPGSDSVEMYGIFEKMLSYSIPKYAVWCIGQNDPDSETEINANWETYTNKFIDKCNEYGITPILQLIPNAGGGKVDDSNLEGIRLHNFKNEYIKTLGYRYIDIPTLVQSDEYGSWRPYWTASDRVHPSAVSAPIIAKYIIENVPECISE